MTPPRLLPCGCCTGGCVCADHHKGRPGEPPLICEHHREHCHGHPHGWVEEEKAAE